MFTAWRVVTERYADTAFSGEGARLYGGRWNPKGVAMVYTAQTQSLALLEMLVQDSPLRARYVMIPASIPEKIVERIDPASLPRDWREHFSAGRTAANWIGVGAEANQRRAGCSQCGRSCGIQLFAQSQSSGLRARRGWNA